MVNGGGVPSDTAAGAGGGDDGATTVSRLAIPAAKGAGVTGGAAGATSGGGGGGGGVAGAGAATAAGMIAGSGTGAAAWGWRVRFFTFVGFPMRRLRKAEADAIQLTRSERKKKVTTLRTRGMKLGLSEGHLRSTPEAIFIRRGSATLRNCISMAMLSQAAGCWN